MIPAGVRQRTRSLKFLAISLVVVGVLLGGVAVILFVRGYGSDPEPPSGDVASRAGPSSIKPTPQAIASYSVPANDPKYINIPTISVSTSRVMRLGLTRNNQIAVPNNIYDTGWYDGSAKPGENGAMFIYGHVSSWQAKGVFYNLKKLKPGDEVNVTRGDNKKFTYRVVSSKIYPYDKVDMAQVLSPIKPGQAGLNLMTCTGQIIKGTSEFNERLVVFTRLVT